MNEFKQVLAYLDTHRAKIAAVLGFLLAYWTEHQHDLTSGDKNRVVGTIIAGLVLYLNGNSRYEQTSLQTSINKQVLSSNPPPPHV